MGGTGSVVTSVGLVFAFIMMSMSVSELIVIGQVGMTIGLGLLFDTLVVRSLMTPSIAALMGPWFWWPQRVRARPVPVRGRNLLTGCRPSRRREYGHEASCRRNRRRSSRTRVRHACTRRSRH
jgi:uncharacterized membrane protein YdfJ with MMPL/SSD domain